MKFGSKKRDKQVFCKSCNKNVAYIVNDKIERYTPKQVAYKAKEAVCKECGCVVDIPWVNEYNTENLYNAVNEALRKKWRELENK